MDTYALTARPPGTAIAWATKDGIFVEIPCKDGPPFIVRYHKTTLGLQQALNVLVENPEPASRQVQATHPKITRPTANYTDDQRAKARDILKRLKIV